MADPQIAFEMDRAGRLDFDAWVLALAAASGGDLDPQLLARTARCIWWDFDAPVGPAGRMRAVTLYDRAGAETATLWPDPATVLPDPPPPPGPAAGWHAIDAPWATLWAPPGFVGGDPAGDGPAAAATLQSRGADWAAWSNDWLTPAAAMYTQYHGVLAALLFLADVGAPSLDEAAYGLLIRQELDDAHRDITLQWRTEDLTQRMNVHGSQVESVAYGAVAGRPGSRIVCEAPAGFRNGPRRVHIVQYVFMEPPYTLTLNLTLPSAAPDRLGEADRIATTLVFKG